MAVVEKFGEAVTTTKETAFDNSVTQRHDIYAWDITPTGVDLYVYINGNTNQDLTVRNGRTKTIWSINGSINKIEVAAVSSSGTYDCSPVAFG